MRVINSSVVGNGSEILCEGSGRGKRSNESKGWEKENTVLYFHKKHVNRKVDFSQKR